MKDLMRQSPQSYLPRRHTVPYADYKPGLGQPDLTDEQVEAIDRILADETACIALPVIDPFDGVLPTVFPTGWNRRPWAEISLSVYEEPDRLKNGPTAANNIADRVAELLSYGVTVWMHVGGTPFQGDSERDGAH